MSISSVHPCGRVPAPHSYQHSSLVFGFWQIHFFLASLCTATAVCPPVPGSSAHPMCWISYRCFASAQWLFRPCGSVSHSLGLLAGDPLPSFPRRHPPELRFEDPLLCLCVLTLTNPVVDKPSMSSLFRVSAIPPFPYLPPARYFGCKISFRRPLRRLDVITQSVRLIAYSPPAQ